MGLFSGQKRSEDVLPCETSRPAHFGISRHLPYKPEPTSSGPEAHYFYVGDLFESLQLYRKVPISKKSS